MNLTKDLLGAFFGVLVFFSGPWPKFFDSFFLTRVRGACNRLVQGQYSSSINLSRYGGLVLVDLVSGLGEPVKGTGFLV